MKKSSVKNRPISPLTIFAELSIPIDNKKMEIQLFQLNYFLRKDFTKSLKLLSKILPGSPLDFSRALP